MANTFYLPHSIYESFVTLKLIQQQNENSHKNIVIGIARRLEGGTKFSPKLGLFTKRAIIPGEDNGEMALCRSNE